MWKGSSPCTGAHAHVFLREKGTALAQVPTHMFFYVRRNVEQKQPLHRCPRACFYMWKGTALAQVPMHILFYVGRDQPLHMRTSS